MARPSVLIAETERFAVAHDSRRPEPMPADPPPAMILHLLLGAQGGGCERNCLLFCEGSGGFRHGVMTLGPAGEMTVPWQRVASEVLHLDILSLSRPAQAARVRAAVEGLATVPAAVMLWHGMPEMPFLLHALRDWRGPVFAHAGNPHLRPSRWMDLRFLAAERLWPSPHRPTFVCCSEYVARSLGNGWYLGRFPCATVPNGVRPLQGGGHRPRPLAPDAPCTVGMLARLDRIKDHATVLRAVALARERLPGLRLEFAGDGPEKERLRALAAELGLADAARFLGSVGAIYNTLAGWDVFVYAATVHEGFGNALAEALTCGLPSIVTDIGPMREVCGEAAEGAVVYVPPSDPAAMAAALVTLVPDLAQRQALGEAATRRAEREFGAGVYAERYERIFRRAVAGKEQPA